MSRYLLVKITFLIGFAILIGVILLFLFRFLRGNQMDKDFCQALIENDRATLKIHLDRELAVIQPSMQQKKKLEHIQSWLAQQECIVNVEILPDLLDSEPPIQEIRITVESEPGVSTTRIIGILLFPDKLRFDYK